METEYIQHLTLDGHRITICYTFRETWQRLLNGHMRPPVVVKVESPTGKNKEELIAVFQIIAPDILFIIREYLSIVSQRFEGISFTYMFVNHSMEREENGVKFIQYRAELKWFYND